jgi:hypothetical protein
LRTQRILSGLDPSWVRTPRPATADASDTSGPARPDAEGPERPDDDAAAAGTSGQADADETVDEQNADGSAAGESDGDAPVSQPVPVARARADVDLIVHINTLADLADAVRRGVLVEVGGFGLVPADVAARLVKAAAARPSVWCLTAVDDTGRVVEHVRTTHDPTTAMREFVRARDRHGRFPGCLVTAVRCDNDHTVAHDTGGPTCPCNMAPLCRRHHRLKQAQGFGLTIDTTSNNARWTTPHTDGATAPPWRHGHDDPAPF